MGIPVIALRGLCVLPEMVVHFDVSREKSIGAVEAAMRTDQRLFVVAQRDVETEDPAQEDLFRIGTIVRIKQMLRMPNKIVRVLVEGVDRAELISLVEGEEYLYGEVEVRSLPSAYGEIDSLTQEAMSRILKEDLAAYSVANPMVGGQLFGQLENISGLSRLLSAIALNLPFGWVEKQNILNAENYSDMYSYIEKLLRHETEVFQIKNELQGKVKESIDQNQKEYVLREQMRVIREELGEENVPEEAEEFTRRVKEMKASDEVKEKLFKEISRFRTMGSNNQEAYVLRTYLETVLELPWGIETEENTDILHAEEILNQDHYGLEKIKDRIVEHLAVRLLTGGRDRAILCLVGPPGTGKTSVARSIARALNRNYVRVCLGGVRDEAEIRGHRKTYLGSMPGRIAEGLRQAKSCNPLMLLDEIDKLGNDYKGDPSSALLEVLDSEQNCRFRDHYLEVPLDLSKVLFVATANTLDTVPKPLLDRMEIIEVSSYTANEKFHIAKEYLVPKQKKQNGLAENQFSISDNAIRKVIQNYTREAGVRSLERRIGELCRKAAREMLETKKEGVRITEGNLEKYLGTEKITYEKANETDEIGIVRGLAWTSAGGDTLEIEVNVMEGTGKVQLTGQLGDVMKESAQTAISYIRSIGPNYDLDGEYFDHHDIHIHIPEGAVPKDGPSAGITMATAILSAVSKRKVKAELAMTGEITLRGRVLPIGGLKEKLLAAKTADIHHVLVPEKNRSDVAELSKEITNGLEITYVKGMEDVVERAFV